MGVEMSLYRLIDLLLAFLTSLSVEKSSSDLGWVKHYPSRRICFLRVLEFIIVDRIRS